MSELTSEQMIRLIVKALDANARRFAAARRTVKTGRSAASGQFNPRARSKKATAKTGKNRRAR